MSKVDRKLGIGKMRRDGSAHHTGANHGDSFDTFVHRYSQESLVSGLEGLDPAGY